MRIPFIFKLLLLTVMSAVILNAQTEAEKAFKAQEPVLITSIGQSADIIMVKILAKKAGLQFEVDKTAKPEKADSCKTLIVVCGGSTKGLGAAKIDKEDEYARAEAVIKRAKKNKAAILAVHLGGKSRRGALSDYFNKLGAENADHIIVVKSGDADGFFANIAKEKGIGIDTSDKIVSIQAILKDIFDKNQAENIE